MDHLEHNVEQFPRFAAVLTTKLDFLASALSDWLSCWPSCSWRLYIACATSVGRLGSRLCRRFFWHAVLSCCFFPCCDESRLSRCFFCRYRRCISLCLCRCRRCSRRCRRI